MFRPKLLLTSLAALALGACAPSDPQAVTSAAIASQVILPTYSRWVDADRQLAISALSYCQGKSDLDTARADFLHAQKAWAELQPLLIGPLAEGNRAWQIQFWPDKKNLVGRQVEQLVTAQPQISADALSKSSVVVQGLSAYEYILFDANIDMANAEQKARYCPLLMAIGERQKALAEEILSSWNSNDGMLAQLSKFPNQRYADSHEAIAESAARASDRTGLAEEKARHPAGPSDQGRPAAVSGRCLAQQSRRCTAWRPAWPVPPDGLGRRRQQGPARPAAQAIRSLWPTRSTPPTPRALDTVRRAAALARRNARQTKQAASNSTTFYDSLNVVHRLHEGELAKALGIQLGFNANDGD